MTQLNPYLSFDGNAEAAMNFYGSVFGSELAAVMRWGDNPQCESFSDADKNKVMHTALPVGDSMIMASDFVGMPGQEYTAGNNFSIAISPDSREDADRLFAGLSEGGTVSMPMTDMFWGGYFGSFTDKFGVQWLINQGGGQQPS
jgi:PhnB protein